MFITARKVKYYTTKSGATPFIEWIEKLDNTSISIIYNRLERLKIGNFGDYKNVGNGVFELRFHLKSGFRIYFGKSGKDIILILCGGNKSTQNRDVKKAKIYWRR